MRTALLLWALCGAAFAQDEPPRPAPIEELVGIEGVAPALPRPADADVEALSIDVADELRCPVCQGLSVADSQAETAVTMYSRVRELVRLGYSEEQIQTYFIERYGEWVLLAPPATGLAVWLWALPVLLVLLSAAGVVSMTRRRRAPTAAAGPLQTDDPYIQRILRDLEDK